MLAVLLQIAPRSNGWFTWCTKLPGVTSYEYLAARNLDYKSSLRELISIAPRPCSYKKWMRLLDLIGAETGGLGKCVRCHREMPLAEMVHRGSDRDMSQVAGFRCQRCDDFITSGKYRGESIYTTPYGRPQYGKR